MVGINAMAHTPYPPLLDLSSEKQRYDAHRCIGKLV